MKNRFNNLFLSVALALPLAFIGGCTMMDADKHVDQDTSETLAIKLVKGRTTKDQVRAIYGTPSGTGLKEGREYWQYQHVKTYVLATKSTYLTIFFEKNNTVHGYDLEKF